MTNLDFSILMVSEFVNLGLKSCVHVSKSKKMAGYELRGYSLFYAEDGADKLIESRVCH